MRKRYWFVLFSVLAIAAVVVLSSSLSTLELEGGQPLPRIPTQEGRLESPPSATRFFAIVLEVLLLVAVALLPFVIYYLASREARERALRDLILIISVLLPIFLLARGRVQTLEETVDEIDVAPAAPPGLPTGSDVSFTAAPSQGLILVANIAFALLLAALLVGLAWALWQRSRRKPTPLDKLAQEAQHAIDAIETGADLRDTITRCYFEMMQVLREERGIRRQQAMTPREFEARLGEVGIPTTQVRRLTRLFEEVRYGDKQLGQREERQAVVSLTSIVRFCRSMS